jgi:hypothetical protein
MFHFAKSIVPLLYLLLVGCQGQMVAPTAPGAITHHRESERWRFALPTAPIVMRVPERGTTLVVMLPQGVVPASFEQTHEESQLLQPQNPADVATLSSGTQGMTMTIPPSYKPADLPTSPTPAQKALGGLIWLGGALVVLGTLGVTLRFLPWTSTLGAVVPIGVSVLVALSGGLLIAYATVLATAPWWVTGVCIAGVVAIGFWVALRDNFKLLGRKSAKRPSSESPTLVT